MGIKSQYLGEINIPEEHRAEYAQQALKLLRAGGMVTVEPVQLYGHKLYLLSPPELDEEDGKAVGHYNYLDENSGERWCLNAKDGWFGCGKIIGSCYYSTIAAVHILTTLWSTSYAATLINGCLVREKTFEELEALNAGTAEHPAKIPTLREFLEYCAGVPELIVILEVKVYKNDEGAEKVAYAVDETVKLCEELGLCDRVIFNSFDAYVLEYIYKTYGLRDSILFR